MRNEYKATEVIEIGEAQDLILGEKFGLDPDAGQPRINPDNDFDE